MKSGAAVLRTLIAQDLPTVMPLVLDPISAMQAQRAGFKALYLGGGTLGYVKTVTEANLSLTQMAQTGLEIRAASELPLILDGQCGWGDAMHTRTTMAMAEAAGFAAIEIEDQLMPKRAHHHLGIEHLIPAEMMVHKVREAVAARRDPDFVIIARTNACRTDDLDEAIRRAEAYKKAGADMLLVLPKNPEQARTIGERVEGPLFYMMLGGIASIGMSLPELGTLGYKLVVDAVTPFFARQKALRLCYEALANGLPDPTVGGELGNEAELTHEVIGLEAMLSIERRTVER
ncbi:isocitrate lyase/PEP mutase family protein [Caballeronia zhejiangensis]|uniref:isocitrate lyase/PEP mutase family protein n=1 Tax=Caballeronia zhejiangensis TaxID=871203 RepID=UPI001EF5A124|nr:isocitrate lyase/PEP mutase family protein [Caballeronia zhejiangensis]MCG7400352.1 isocitrate lyase/PEP mutase family protein [Caballeronia zhejiangensis]